MLSEVAPHETKTTKSTEQMPQNAYAEYIDDLEEKTGEMISAIDGVGACRVMITLCDTNERVYAQNSEQADRDGSFSKSDEYVLYDGQEGETPLLIEQVFPKVQGIIVVCEGADNQVVRENVINSLTSLYHLSSSRISVAKMKSR